MKNEIAIEQTLALQAECSCCVKIYGTRLFIHVWKLLTGLKIAIG